MMHSDINKHKYNCLIVTVIGKEAIVREAGVKNSIAALTAYFQSFGKEENRTVVESTTGWYWLDDLLASLGIGEILDMQGI